MTSNYENNLPKVLFFFMSVFFSNLVDVSDIFLFLGVGEKDEGVRGGCRGPFESIKKREGGGGFRGGGVGGGRAVGECMWGGGS